MVWDFMYPSQKVNHGSFTDDKLATARDCTLYHCMLY